MATTDFETVRQHAERMGVTEWTVRQWIKKGHLAAEQPAGRNGSYRIPVASRPEAKLAG